MRLWHKDLLPYLPDRQFKGQLRELVAIMHDWRDKGKTNHLLINRVMDYPKEHLVEYFWRYAVEYRKRYNKLIKEDIVLEFIRFAETHESIYNVFEGWHDDNYLKVCMANLYEKAKYGKGNSKITDEEWDWLFYGYSKITNGEEYYI